MYSDCSLAAAPCNRVGLPALPFDDVLFELLQLLGDRE